MQRFKNCSPPPIQPHQQTENQQAQRKDSLWKFPIANGKNYNFLGIMGGLLYKTFCLTTYTNYYELYIRYSHLTQFFTKCHKNLKSIISPKSYRQNTVGVKIGNYTQRYFNARSVKIKKKLLVCVPEKMCTMCTQVPEGGRRGCLVPWSWS